MKSPHSNIPAATCWALVLVLAAAKPHAWCQDHGDAGRPRQSPIEFFRVKVKPDDFTDKRQRPNFGYAKTDWVTIEQAEFERLVKIANAGAAERASSTTNIKSAVFEANLQGTSLVGVARLAIEKQVSGEPFVSLDGCNIAIRSMPDHPSAFWEDGQTAKIRLNSNGAITAPVERSGVLNLLWSLQGRSNGSGSLTFDLSLPQSVAGQIDIELPEDYQLFTAGGIGAQPGAPIAGKRKWQLLMGGQTGVQLSVVPSQAAETPQGVLVANQHTEYLVDLAGIQVVSQFELESRGGPVNVSTLPIHLDQGLRLVGASLDGEKVEWDHLADEDERQLELNLKQQFLPLARRRLTLVAIGEAAPGSPAKLPNLRPAIVLWQAGEAQVRWDDRLQLDGLEIFRGMLTSVRAAGGDNTAAIGVRFFDRDGAASVAFSPTEARLAMQPTYAWRLLDDRALGRLTARLTCGAKGTNTLHGRVAAGWLIDEDEIRIVSQPENGGAEVVHSVRLEPTYDAPADADRLQNIVFDPPLAPGRALQVEIEARGELARTDATVPLSQLEFFTLKDVRVEELTGAITTSTPQSVRVRGDSRLKFLTYDELDPATAQWLASESSAAVFSTTAAMASVEVQLVQGARRLTTAIDVAVGASARHFTETYEIQCIPDGAGIDRLRVHFWPPRSAPLAWSFPNAQEQDDIRVERVSPGSTLEQGPSAEIWEVVFPRRNSSPFSIAAKRTNAAWSETSTNISLAGVESSTSQTGRCVIASEKGVPLQVKAWGMRRVATPATQSKDAVWGAFRYAPSPTLPDGNVGLEIARRAASDASSLAWQFVLESGYGRGESSIHRATWLLHVEGRSRVRIQLPTAAQMHAAMANGAAAEVIDDAQSGYIIPLPVGETVVRLVVDYTLPSEPLAVWQSLAPSPPMIDLPVVHSCWRVILPDGHRPVAQRSLRVQLPDSRAPGDYLLGPPGVGNVDANAAGLSLGDAESLIASPQAAEIRQRIRMLAEKLTQRETTWGQALWDYQFAPERQGNSSVGLLLIDAQALSQLRISAETPVPPGDGASPEERLRRLLSESDLAVVATPDYLFLTSADFVRSHAGQLVRDETNGVAWVTGQSLLKLLSGGGLLTSPRITTPQIWVPPLSPESSPWQLTGDDSWSLSEATSEYQLAIAGEQPDVISIYDVRAFRAFGFAAMLASLAMVVWWPALKFEWLVALAAAAGVLALCLSEPLWCIAGGAMLGLLVGSVYRWGLRPRSQPASETARASTTAIVKLLILLLTPVLAASALPALAEEEQADTQVYPVRVRVDYDGKEMKNGFVDVPKTFLAELERREAAAKLPSQSWTITGANYSAHLKWHAREPTLELQFIDVEYTVDVQGDAKEIVLPLPHDDAVLIGGVKVDGKAVDATWRVRDLVVKLQQSAQGEHTLALRVQLFVTETAGSHQCRMSIPRVINARLQVFAPDDAPLPQLPTCVGRIESRASGAESLEADSEQPSLRADLGPTDQLRIRWQGRSIAEDDSDTFDAEEHYWLKYDEQGPRIDMVIRVTSQRAQIQQITLETESDALSPASSAAELRPAPLVNGRRRYRLPVVVSPDKTQIAKASFRLTNVPVAGQYVLPDIHLIGARKRRCWFAVTPPDGALANLPKSLNEKNVEAFLKRWGDSDEDPARVCAWNLQGGQMLTVQLVPLRGPISIRQSLRYGFASDYADVEFRAHVAAGSSVNLPLQYALNVPAEFTLSDVRVVASGAESQLANDAVAWWSHRSHVVEIFLTRPIPDNHELVVSGYFALPEDKAAQLPAMGPRDVDVESTDIYIHHNSRTLVDVTHGEAIAQVQSNPVWIEKWGRLAGHWRLTDGAAGENYLRVRAAANNPQVRGVQLATLKRSDVAWNLRVAVHITVESPPDGKRGVVDRLEFQLPAELAQKLILEPECEHYFLPSQDAARSRLVVVPAAPIESQWRLQMTFHDVVPPGQRVQLPDVRPLNLALERFAVVPSSIESQSILWDTRNMQSVSASSALDTLGVEIGAQNLYRVLEDPYRLTLRSLRSSTDVPLVRLADIRFVWEGGDHFSGLATYNLEPGGKSRCTIEVPKFARILDVRLSNLPAEVVDRAENSWEVELAGHNLPQRVDVVYEGEYTLRSASITAIAPSLRDVTVERTAWSIWTPEWIGTEGGDATDDVSAVQLELLRLRSLTELIRLPSHHRLEHSTGETRDWIAPWRAHWRRCYRDVIRSDLLAQSVAEGSYASVDLSGLDHSFTQTMEEFGIAEDEGAAMGDAGSFDRLWEASIPLNMPITRRVTKGGGTTLAVPFAPAPRSELPRYLLAGVLLVFAGLIIVGRRWLRRNDWPLRSGHALGVLAGLAWALFLWPPQLGWAIIAVSLITLFWRGGAFAQARRGEDIVLQAGGSGGNQQTA